MIELLRDLWPVWLLFAMLGWVSEAVSGRLIYWQRKYIKMLQAKEPKVVAPMPLDLLESLVENGDCWFDHNGGCQEHGYYSLEPGEVCPQEQLKRLINLHNGGYQP